jgi:fumarylacetoacetase
MRSASVEIPDGSLFGLDNLPYGVFSVGRAGPRAGVRVGDSVADLTVLLDEPAFHAPSLNPFMATGPGNWASVRAEIQEVLDSGYLPDGAVYPLGEVTLHLPFEVADYVDFYASEHHATNVGQIFRPGQPPLQPNWKSLPVGYHGRAGTVVVSGTDIIRPNGQHRYQPRGGDSGLTFSASQQLDIEAEIGFVVGVGTPRGKPIPVDDFAQHVFGVVIVNDWSARDIQAWESVPLGPHLGKSFATSVSPWVVPLAALEAARTLPVSGQDDTRPGFSHLRDKHEWGLDIDLVVTWNGQEVSRPPFRSQYWSGAQMLAHMTSNGASSRTGDLFASGTVSGPAKDQRGSLLELTWGGAEPVTVNGEPRTFLEDGDEVTITATAPGTAGGRVGFGEVTGKVAPPRDGDAMIAGLTAETGPGR